MINPAAAVLQIRMKVSNDDLKKIHFENAETYAHICPSPSPLSQKLRWPEWTTQTGPRDQIINPATDVLQIRIKVNPAAAVLYMRGKGEH